MEPGNYWVFYKLFQLVLIINSVLGALLPSPIVH